MSAIHIHSIVLAVNEPPQGLVDQVVKSMAGRVCRAVWCADVESLAQLPPPEGLIRYVVVGTSGSLTLEDIIPHIGSDLSLVAVWGPGGQNFGL